LSRRSLLTTPKRFLATVSGEGGCIEPSGRVPAGSRLAALSGCHQSNRESVRSQKVSGKEFQRATGRSG
jgi:hypothetical protein